jgi:alkanesulfonate monooxygenase SsuD/methylene tetrahydromethanopterin reductase-like flavin-dependent oxidoreductase (luciferase family)
MNGLVFGRDEAAVRQKMGLYGHAQSAEDLRARGIIVGTGDAVVEQLRALAEAGVQRVMLQWLDLDDLDGLTALAQTVLPHFAP